MKNLSGQRAFRVTREVYITRVEVTTEAHPSGEISTAGHKEPLHGWDLAETRRVVSIEEVTLPDEAAIAQAPHIQVEYVEADMSREHDGIIVFIPLLLVELLGSVEAAFELCIDEDRSMIVSYDESFSILYTADGGYWEGDEDDVYLLPGQQTDLRSFVSYVVNPTRTPLVTRFVLGDYMVEWECLTVEDDRVGADEFDVYRGGDHLKCVHMRRDVDEDALLAIAAHIAPSRPLEEIIGTVS